MKHKVITRAFPEFCQYFDTLVKRLDQTGEKIVRSKFVLDERPFGHYVATVWTERAKDSAPMKKHGYGTPDMAGTGVVNGG